MLPPYKLFTLEEKLQGRADPEELQVVGFYASRDRLATIEAEIGRMAAKRVPHHPAVTELLETNPPALDAERNLLGDCVVNSDHQLKT